MPRVGWMEQIGTRVSNLLRTISCHKGTHRALQVQIHKTTPRVDWLGRIATLQTGVSLCSNLPDSISYD